MSLRRNPNCFFTIENPAGGTDYVPPAFCLRPAHIPAYAAAHAEATRSPERDGRAVRRVLGQVG